MLASQANLFGPKATTDLNNDGKVNAADTRVLQGDTQFGLDGIANTADDPPPEEKPNLWKEQGLDRIVATNLNNLKNGNTETIYTDRETRVINHLIFVLGRIKASNVIKFCINYKSLNGLGGLFMGNWDRVDEPIRYSNPIQR